MVESSQVGFKIATFLLALPLTFFYGFLTAGCVSTSPGVPSLDLLRWQVDKQHSVRVGYYDELARGACPAPLYVWLTRPGLCALTGTETTCTGTAFSSNTSIAERLQGGNHINPIPSSAIAVAMKLQPLPILNLLTVATILTLCGLACELYRTYTTKRTRKVAITTQEVRRQNFYRQFSLALTWAGSSATFAAAFTNTRNGQTASILSGGAVTTGRASLALHWAAWVTSLMLATGLTLIRRTKTYELYDL